MERDEGLAEVFGAVARRLREVSRETLGPLGITPAQARALGVLARHAPVRPGTLAGHLRIAARSATEVVDDLEARGLVARAPDPDDRRATLLTLTAEGTRVAHDIRAARRAEAERFFGALSATDRADLARILNQLR